MSAGAGQWNYSRNGDQCDSSWITLQVVHAVFTLAENKLIFSFCEEEDLKIFNSLFLKNRVDTSCD